MRRRRRLPLERARLPRVATDALAPEERVEEVDHEEDLPREEREGAVGDRLVERLQVRVDLVGVRIRRAAHQSGDAETMGPSIVPTRPLLSALQAIRPSDTIETVLTPARRFLGAKQCVSGRSKTATVQNQPACRANQRELSDINTRTKRPMVKHQWEPGMSVDFCHPQSPISAPGTMRR